MPRVTLDTPQLRVCSLASGSDGNCTLVCAGSAALLIDAGISARAALAGVRAAGLEDNAVEAVLLTHEHSDHIRGLGAIARRLGACVVANRTTLTRVAAQLSGVRVQPLETGEADEIVGIRVRSFPVSHDAAEAVGYVLEAGGKRVGYVTDTGVASAALSAQLGNLDLAVIEANHDIARLLAGPYPRALKERILSDAGHLSNAAAAELVLSLGRDRPGLEVWLAHLSQVNNTPKLALAAVNARLVECGLYSVKVQVAPRGRPGPIWSGVRGQLPLF